MKNVFTLTLLAVLFYSCQSQVPDSGAKAADTSLVRPPTVKLSPAEIRKYHNAVEGILNKTLLRNNFNGAILVAKNGTIVYENYVGVKDVRVKTKDSLTAETPFQVASTGKTLTGAGVLKLVQDGKLSLDDSVNKFFPGFPYPGISVKLLLNHRSGLPNYLNYMEKGGWNRKHQATNTDVLTTLMSWKPAKAANPDRRFEYCNTNFVLLALIIEKVSGETFPEFMRKTIFEPLGMKNTFVVGPNQQAPHLQSFQGNQALWAMDFSDGPYGDKNIYSTPQDLLLWDQSLYAEKLLTAETLNAAFTPYSNEKPGIHNYGLGWRMLLFPTGKKVIYHNGHWHGFNSAFARLVDEEATIIIISNNHKAAVYPVAKMLYEVFGDYGGKPLVGEE